MSIGGVPSAAANLAGQALSPKGADADRAAREASNLARSQSAAHKAEAASDVGETSDDVQTGDGEADGRQMWSQAQQQSSANEEERRKAKHVKAPDPTGEMGNELDLEG